MTEEMRAALRDECEVDAWTEQWDRDDPDDEAAIAECENCGAGIYVYDEPLGLVVPEKNRYRTMYICKDCFRQMHITDILELMDIMYYEGYDADKAVEKTSRSCRELNAIAKKGEQDRIAIAANMVKAATLKEARA